jgi:periplasmic protein CpxP/Spy
MQEGPSRAEGGVSMHARVARRLFLAVLGVAGMLTAGIPAVAQGAGPGPGAGHVGPGFIAHRPPMERAFRFHGIQGKWWDNPRVAADLKITPDQQKAMDSILYDHREKLIHMQADLQEAELGMEPLMNADEPNQAAIEAQIDKVVQSRAALEKANAEFLLAIRMKLTPDQWKQIKNFREEGGMRGMRGDMRGHRGGGWGPGGPGGPGGPMPPPSTAPAPPSNGTSNPPSGAEQ